MKRSGVKPQANRDARGRFIAGHSVQPPRSEAERTAATRERRRRSQLGNLNRAQHPWRSFWRRRATRPEDRWVSPIVERYEGDLLADKGDATEAEIRLARIAATAHGCGLLILNEAARRGLVVENGKTWDLQPGVSELVRFLSLEAKALGALGLGRRAKAVPTLAAYRREASEASDETQPAPRRARGGPEPGPESNSARDASAAQVSRSNESAEGNQGRAPEPPSERQPDTAMPKLGERPPDLPEAIEQSGRPDGATDDRGPLARAAGYPRPRRYRRF